MFGAARRVQVDAVFALQMSCLFRKAHQCVERLLKLWWFLINKDVKQITKSLTILTCFLWIFVRTVENVVPSFLKRFSPLLLQRRSKTEVP